jgi:hypothetical protein
MTTQLYNYRNQQLHVPSSFSSTISTTCSSSRLRVTTYASGTTKLAAHERNLLLTTHAQL